MLLCVVPAPFLKRQFTPFTLVSPLSPSTLTTPLFLKTNIIYRINCISSIEFHISNTGFWSYFGISSSFNTDKHPDDHSVCIRATVDDAFNGFRPCNCKRRATCLYISSCLLALLSRSWMWCWKESLCPR